jgi:PhzF family phenazine biosynthesis protein
MKFWIVDAFTDVLFKGNPAAVYLVDQFPEESLMQNIALEMNLSETTFVKHQEKNRFLIRWFTPLEEAPLCGHATFAAAHTIWENGVCADPKLEFEFNGGMLSTIRHEEGSITITLPSKPIIPTAMPELLNRALGYIPVKAVYKDDLIYVVVLSNPDDLVGLHPSYSKISHIPCRGVVITSLNQNDYIPGGADFISRYFAPRVGIFEDPVCGSAHCRLVPFWGEHLQKKEMVAYQASKRGGMMKVSYDSEHVNLSARAVISVEGNLLLSSSE